MSLKQEPAKWFISLMEHVNFPSLFDIKQVVSFVLNDTEHTATVRAVHFTESKVRYDLDVWLLKEGGNSSTRIYNVDSCLVKEPLMLESKTV